MSALLLIHRRVTRKIAFDELTFKSYADQSANSVFTKAGYVNNCVAFIDGTIRRICRPVEHQREAYSGFKKCHCIKFQGVMMANGLVVSLHGPIEGRRHDSFILNDSKIATRMKYHFPGQYLYRDAGYGIKKWLIRPYQTSGLTKKQKKFNKALSRARVSVKWLFGEVVQYWAHIDFKNGMKIGKSPVGAMYIVSTFLTNSLMCANRLSKSSKYFNCPLPSLEEYIANVDQGADDSDEQVDDDESDLDDVGDCFDEDDGPCDDCCVDDRKGNDETPYRVRTLLPDELRLVSTALHEGPENEVIIQKYSITITRERMQCLSPMQWLHGDVIKFWFAMLQDRDSRLHTDGFVPARSHFFSTFFYSQLTNGSYSYLNLRRWTRQIDLFAMDKVFVPVNVSNSHWCLAVVYVQQKQIKYYDSFLGPGHTCLRNLLRYLGDEMRDKREVEFDANSWKLLPTDEATPQQENGFDCGVFTCIFADYLSRDHRLTFCQKDMPFHRQRMVLRILNPFAVTPE